MQSTESRRKLDRSRRVVDDRREDPPGRFWGELYWFGILLGIGWILALMVLPPKLTALRESLRFEAECRARVEALDTRNAFLKKSVAALESDPFFREEAYRAVVGQKASLEEFLTGEFRTGARGPQ